MVEESSFSASEAAPLVEALAQCLLARYGTTMCLADIAAELHLTPVALRIRQSRFGDLPAPIPHLRTLRWPTPTVAVWLCGLSDKRFAPAKPAGPRFPSRRGRRRLLRSAIPPLRVVDESHQGRIAKEGAP